MSRFGNLEFGDDSAESLRDPLVVKDEAYYESQAVRAFERGQFEQGLRAYAKVLEHNPKNAAAWTGQVRMLIELGEFREAKLWAEKALTMFPREPELLAAKAVALARTGDFRAAMSFSDASMEEKGDSPYIWLARGDILLAGKQKRADFCFDKAFALSRGGWVWRWLVSRVYAYYKQFARALQHARQALGIDSGQAVLWLQAGQCELALGLVSQAKHSLAQARELDEESGQAAEALKEASETGFWTKISRRCRQWLEK